MTSRDNPVYASLVDELRRALSRLYDPTAVGRSPLIGVLGADRREDPAAYLQNLLLEAIEALKPAPQVPPQSRAWQVYRVMSQRYAAQLTQVQVTRHLGISERQLRRLQVAGLDALAKHLWTRHGLAERTAGPGALVPDQGASEAEVPGMPSRDEELEWLRRSYPSEPVDVAAVLQAVLRTAAPLLRSASLQVDCRVPRSLPRLATHPTVLRQILLNLLSIAGHVAPKGRIHIQAKAVDWQVAITFCALPGSQGPAPAQARIPSESLNMVRQLVAVCGGELAQLPSEGKRGAFGVRLLMPAAEQTTVLAIDDNEDTLTLLQRYLAGSRYRCVCQRDAQEALAQAEALAPRAIVLDVMLPGIDGWELLERLREHPKTRGVPVVVCTILPAEALALALGAAAFLRKPVSPSALLDALRRVAP